MATALLDSDVIAYRSAILTEQGHGDHLDAHEFAGTIAETWANRAECDDFIVCLSHRSFRYDIWPDYKANRKGKDKPQFLNAAYAGLHEYPTRGFKKLEADDVMGVLQGQLEQPTVIVSIDKDMCQIPGLLFNPDKGLKNITKDEGLRWFYTQWLCGDTIDHYPGLPKVGPKRAAPVVAAAASEGSVMPIIEAFRERGHSDSYAITQGRLARIWTVEDYDHRKHAATPQWLVGYDESTKNLPTRSNR